MGKALWESHGNGNWLQNWEWEWEWEWEGMGISNVLQVRWQDLAVDGVAMHGEVLSGGEATLADCTDETVDVVDVLASVHHELVSIDRPQAARTQLRRE